jgi:hypothetical protein
MRLLLLSLISFALLVLGENGVTKSGAAPAYTDYLFAYVRIPAIDADHCYVSKSMQQCLHLR